MALAWNQGWRQYMQLYSSGSVVSKAQTCASETWFGHAEDQEVLIVMNFVPHSFDHNPNEHLQSQLKSEKAKDFRFSTKLLVEHLSLF